MDCPNCGAEMIAFAVPAAMRERAPDGAETVAACPNCLSLEPTDDAPAEDAAVARISEALPDRNEPATAMLLAVGLLSSLALNRADVLALFEAVERAGVDPLLVLDRLAADPDLDPAVDLERRRHQLLQLMD